jgi:hypothetical protein
MGRIISSFILNPLEFVGSIISFLTFLGDVTTDIVVSIYYFSYSHNVWGILTLLLVILPGWIVSFFSFYWQREDDKRLGICSLFLHLFCLAPLWRYWHALVALISARPTVTGSYVESLRDVSMLRLIEGVCESTPQLILQLYIILSGNHVTDYVAIVSSTFSVVSVGWGLASYIRALRKAYAADTKHQEMTRPAVVVYFLWRSFEFMSRVLVFVLFAFSFKLFVLIPITVRWILGKIIYYDS